MINTNQSDNSVIIVHPTGYFIASTYTLRELLIEDTFCRGKIDPEPSKTRLELWPTRVFDWLRLSQVKTFQSPHINCPPIIALFFFSSENFFLSQLFRTENWKYLKQSVNNFISRIL